MAFSRLMTEMRFWDDTFTTWCSVTGLCWISFLLNPGCFRAQIPSTDARFVALGSHSAADEDAFAGRANPAAVTSVRHLVAGVGHTRPFGVSELATNSLALAFPLRRLGLRIGFLEFGYEAFSRRKLMMSVGGSGGPLSVGAEVALQSMSMSGYRGETALLFRSGWQFEIGSRIGVGASVGTVGDGTTLAVGIRGHPSSRSIVLGSVVATKGHEPDLRIGVEVWPLDVIAVRLGVQIDPPLTCGGIGFRFQRFAVDLGGSMHPRLGLSTVVTVKFPR